MENKCIKNSDTCNSIPPGGCGPDCHGFEKMEKGKWLGGTLCENCNKDILFDGTCNFFTDTKTIHGPWALLCEDCHALTGTKIGQMYGPDKKKIKNLNE